MAHVRPGKTAKRNRRQTALWRLFKLHNRHVWRQASDLNYTDSDRKRYEQIKAEIATLKSRI